MHGVIDGAVSAYSLRVLQREWPFQHRGWVRYDSPGEVKLALRDGLPEAFASSLEWLDRYCPDGLVPDPTRHGAGLHMMPVGGWLDVHLDCDRHPATGYRRARNAILFLDDWQSEWGGDLCLYSADLQAVERITPKAGRIAWFDCTDDSYHGVPGPIVGPIPRRSLAVYWWEPVDWPARRPRAQFVGLPGEPHNPEKEEWRRARSAAVS